MKNILKISTTFFLLFVCLACGELATKTNGESSNNAVAQTINIQKKTEDCNTLDFHYLVTWDSMVTPNTRQINIFLDEKAFSEENLKTLFTYLSDKDSNSENLMIFVKTNWQQLSLPTDCPPSGMSGGNGKPDKYEYHEAKFYRREENEFFTYNPTLKTSKFKDVQLKGNKVLINGKWQ